MTAVGIWVRPRGKIWRDRGESRMGSNAYASNTSNKHQFVRAEMLTFICCSPQKEREKIMPSPASLALTMQGSGGVLCLFLVVLQVFKLVMSCLLQLFESRSCDVHGSSNASQDFGRLQGAGLMSQACC